MPQRKEMNAMVLDKNFEKHSSTLKFRRHAILAMEYCSSTYKRLMRRRVFLVVKVSLKCTGRCPRIS